MLCYVTLHRIELCYIVAHCIPLHYITLDYLSTLYPYTPNPPSNIAGFRGLDSSIIFI